MKVLIESKDAKYYYGKNMANGKLFRFKVKDEKEPFVLENVFKIVDLDITDFTVLRVGEGVKIFRKK